MSELATAPAEPTSHAARVHQVAGWIIAGYSQQDIGESIQKLWPKQKTAPLIAGALKSIKSAGEIDVELARGWCMEAMRSLYVKAIEVNDLATALRCVKEIGQLHGV